MSYEYQLSLCVLMCHLKLVFSYEFSVWMIPLRMIPLTCKWDVDVLYCSFLKKKKTVFVKGVDEFKREIILLLILCTFQFC